MHFTSALVGYVVAGSGYSGGEGAISKTIDGGATCTQLNTGASMEFYGSTFLDNNTIFGYGNTGTTGRIIRSTDAGATWYQVAIQEPVPRIFDLVFANNGHGFAGTSSGSVYESYDAGTTWLSTYTAPIFPFGIHCIGVGGGTAYGFGIGPYFVKNNDFVGVEEFEQQLAASLWPNPNNGQGFDIHLEGATSAVLLEVTDLQGRQVHAEQLFSSSMPHQIGLANALKPGVYQCAVISGAKRWTARLLVQ